MQKNVFIHKSNHSHTMLGTLPKEITHNNGGKYYRYIRNILVSTFCIVYYYITYIVFNWLTHLNKIKYNIKKRIIHKIQVHLPKYLK